MEDRVLPTLIVQRGLSAMNGDANNWTSNGPQNLR